MSDHKLRFEAVVWFSARDIDLLPSGPRPVRPHGLSIDDFANEFVQLMDPSERSTKGFNSILKFFQVDITGIVRMTSCARYFKEGVGSRRPNWRWIMCFLGGAAEGKYLVQGVREALEVILRIVGRHQGVDDIDQALHLHIGP